ncbi:DUF6270 domain-containing protein [Luteimicrobium sp. NPDC057192]|uniref:DUF6270 domain-containing protein n=1 Tax=Luteimicrobium sp. NPDC057192 TaxID=3346042 RepID=UPI003641953D
MPVLPIKVAVFGSCVSRDVFNRRFSPNYKDLFDCVLLSNQSTVVAQTSPPIDASTVDLSGIKDWEQKQVAADLTRSFVPSLREAQPEYVIVDFFGDVHFGCALLDDGVVTRNRWKIVHTPYYKETWRQDLPPDAPEYMDRWLDASHRFADTIREAVPDAKIVLHEARNATHYRTDEGDLKPLHDVPKIRRMNERWARMNDHFRPLADHAVDVFTDETVSFAGHPWGKFPVHYELDYHARFLSRLSAVALHDARASRPDSRQRVGRRLGLVRARRRTGKRASA